MRRGDQKGVRENCCTEMCKIYLRTPNGCDLRSPNRNGIGKRMGGEKKGKGNHRPMTLKAGARFLNLKKKNSIAWEGKRKGNGGQRSEGGVDPPTPTPDHSD